jgi:hypothetical protein
MMLGTRCLQGALRVAFASAVLSLFAGEGVAQQGTQPNWSTQRPFDANKAARPYQDPSRLDRGRDPEYCAPPRRRNSRGDCR